MSRVDWHEQAAIAVSNLRKEARNPRRETSLPAQIYLVVSSLRSFSALCLAPCAGLPPDLPRCLSTVAISKLKVYYLLAIIGPGRSTRPSDKIDLNRPK